MAKESDESLKDYVYILEAILVRLESHDQCHALMVFTKGLQANQSVTDNYL